MYRLYENLLRCIIRISGNLQRSSFLLACRCSLQPGQYLYKIEKNNQQTRITLQLYFCKLNQHCNNIFSFFFVKLQVFRTMNHSTSNKPLGADVTKENEKKVMKENYHMSSGPNGSSLIKASRHAYREHVSCGLLENNTAL